MHRPVLNVVLGEKKNAVLLQSGSTESIWKTIMNDNFMKLSSQHG